MSTRSNYLVLFLSLSVVFVITGQAQQPFEFWPGTRYDPSVPTMEQTLGYAPGDSVASHAELMRYMEALTEAAPARMQLFDYAESWEGRRLVYALIGSERNIARLEEVRAGMQRLGDPRGTSAEDANALIADLPAIAWLSYGVHGSEISSPNAALLTAYHLLAAQGDQTVDEILADAIVAIDPTQNPDGRDRFVHDFTMNLGLEPAESGIAAEHNAPWPGGRTNHYYFDLNRDWFALTQPETRGRVAALQQHYPVVHVDLHEMGVNSTYYFAPAADPYNPFLTQQQRDDLELFGRGNAAWFDRFGFDYFTREVYDAFYPGYGDSWPMFLGASGMTYEQASAGGLVRRRGDGTNLLFRDGVHHHFVASIATAQTAARNRETLLRHLYDLRRTGIEEGETGEVRDFILPWRGDTSAVRKLVGVLVEQGIDVRRASGPLQACDGEYPAGSFSVPVAQPSSRLVRTLLGTDNPFDPAFIAEQERRRGKKLSAQIYDVIAWSLPLLYNVESVACETVAQGDFSPAGTERIDPGTIAGNEADVAYLVPWGQAASARFLAGALRQDLLMLSTDKPFTQNGTQYPAGTLIVKVADNGSGLRATIDRLARETGANVVATDTSWVEDGVNFGSGQVQTVRDIRVAIAWDRPTQPNVAGNTRFVIERQFGYPVTPVRTRQLASADLSRFHVLILPGGSGYQGVLGQAGVRHLREWVEDGGTLIGIDGAMSLLTDPDSDLLDVRQERRASEEGDDEGGSSGRSSDDEEESRVPGRLLESEEDYLEAIQADEELPDSIPGVLVSASIDSDHWLSAGVAETLRVLVRGRAVYQPITLDKGVNVATFDGPDDLLASGYLWEENRKQLAHKPFVIIQPRQRGFVIGFTADPNFRAFADGLNVLFMNAVFRAPMHARPLAATASSR